MVYYAVSPSNRSAYLSKIWHNMTENIVETPKNDRYRQDLYTVIYILYYYVCLYITESKL